MRLIPSDPDIETLVGRIKRKDLDLQPDFQRGEIWPQAKQQRLIDSILRDWHVPPIHVILEGEGRRTSVLDGQQRLAAIRDFVLNKFPVDGHIEPHSDEISSFHRSYFYELPTDIQRTFLSFPIRMFTIVDYRSSEPGELFYRLNQPTTLTAAEQRNAFFGKARIQVKDLVNHAESSSLDYPALGFSNTRLSYDDVITRALFLIDLRTLKRKVTSSALADKYRSGDDFSRSSVDLIHSSIEILERAQRLSKSGIKLSKGGAQTWLIFISQILLNSPFIFKNDDISRFVFLFEGDKSKPLSSFESVSSKFKQRLFSSYEIRSASRVSDILSVQVRDLVTWIYFFEYCRLSGAKIRPTLKREKIELFDFSASKLNDISSLEQLAESLDWGDKL